MRRKLPCCEQRKPVASAGRITVGPGPTALELAVRVQNSGLGVKRHGQPLCRSFRSYVDSQVLAGQHRTPSFVQGLPQTQAVYARRMHAGQRRADGTPFILHPLEVATILYHAGAPDHLVAAGALHDLIEKAGVSAADLRERFGSRIAELVLAVSDDEQIAGYARRKAALRRQVSRAGARVTRS
jgi:hypothetical protein